METKNWECIKCGKELAKKQVRHKCKYCSRECYFNDRWEKTRRTEKVLTKRKTFNEAIKLYRSGKSKPQMAKTLGVSRKTISNWFSKHGIEYTLNNRICEYCGKSLSEIIQRSNRKYCSESCTAKAAYARKHPGKRKNERYLELREKGLDLYWGGLPGKAIGKHLGVSKATVYTWIRDFGHLQEKNLDPEKLIFMPIAAQLKRVKTSAQWQQILCENAPDGDKKSVRLVCGLFDGKGEIEYFTAIVADF